MQDQKTTETKPLTALRKALGKLDSANESVMAAERHLAQAKQEFADKLRALGPIWIQASDAAEKIGEQVPGAFREGGMLVSLDEEGVALAERLPYAADPWRLLDLAEKAGEKAGE